MVCFLFCVAGMLILLGMCGIYACHRVRYRHAFKCMAAACMAFSLVIMSVSFYIPVYADAMVSEEDDAVQDGDSIVSADFELDAKSAVLMEASTGKILYQNNPDEALPPASVTKIMTLLLVMEAVDSGVLSLNDTVTVSEYAASMGGSQVFLEAGEQMKLEDLLKCTVIASANDAAVALAEHLMGSEEAFVKRMNERAVELHLKNCRFENVTGLDDDTTDHVMSAADIAVISKELISHKKILEYSSAWMDTIRDGAFALTNTNRLIRYYDGATGLKTGSTDKAKFCITATAERGGMTLIAVIMGAPTRDVRNACAKTLFDWGFANYAIYIDPSSSGGDIPILRGTDDVLKTTCDSFSIVTEKVNIPKIKRVVSMSECAEAPIRVGDVVGTVSYMIDDTVIGCADVRASNSIDRLNYMGVVGRMFKIFILS